MANQEVQVGPQTYWEGAALVSGDATGRAYVELAGYCQNQQSILPFINF
jgi:predicted secreted hydrolase